MRLHENFIWINVWFAQTLFSGSNLIFHRLVEPACSSGFHEGSHWSSHKISLTLCAQSRRWGGSWDVRRWCCVIVWAQSSASCHSSLHHGFWFIRSCWIWLRCLILRQLLRCGGSGTRNCCINPHLMARSYTTPICARVCSLSPRWSQLVGILSSGACLSAGKVRICAVRIRLA